MTIKYPKCTKIITNKPICGYVTMDGTYFECAHNTHSQLIKCLIWDNDDYRNLYFQIPSFVFNEKPTNLLQEEFLC